MIVVTDYQRSQVKEEKKKTTRKCPKCKQDIPEAEFQQHYKLEMMDPNWKANKD